MTTSPTDPDQLTERGLRTRERLLDAAEDELLASGRIVVTRVATRAGASLGLLYRYFENKDALVDAVVHRFYDRYEEAVFATPTRAELGWYEQEERRLEREVDFLLGDLLAHRLIAGAPEEPAAALADAQRLQHHVRLAARNIAHGQRRGEIDASVDPELAAAGFIGALRSVLAVALPRPDPGVRDDVIRMVLAMGRAAIVPAPDQVTSAPRP
jgi:AcrR family transcriptional regulator